MNKFSIILSGIIGFSMINCGGGAIGSLVKMRDEGKNLGIVCNALLTEPGITQVLVGDGTGATRSVKNGEWDANEKSEFSKWGLTRCGEIVDLLQKSLNYKNVEILDQNKVPTGYREFFGKQMPFPDYSQTRYDYVWKYDIIATKTADRGEISTDVKLRYLVEDWSKKDSSKISIPFQDYDFASCNAGYERSNKQVESVTQSDFKPLTSKTLEQCQAGTQSKISKLQKAIDDLNSKKKS